MPQPLPSGSPDQTVDSLAASVLYSGDITEGTPIRVGDREYVIEELTLLRFLKLSALISREARTLAGTGVLNLANLRRMIKAEQEAEGAALTDLLERLVPVIAELPDVLGEALALVCSAEKADDPAYLVKHLKLRQFAPLLRAFMAVNPWRDLVTDFFRLGGDLQGVLLGRDGATP